MRPVRACQTLLLTGALVISPAFASHAHRSPTSGHSHSKRKPAAHQIRGQRQIDPDRAREIQSALIREKYLTGEPNGDWNQESQQAMQRYQADHHWQTKIIPDSRALISLGLGPATDKSSLAAAAVAAPAVSAPAEVEDAKPAPRNSTNALTLADAHSILN